MNTVSGWLVCMAIFIGVGHLIHVKAACDEKIISLVYKACMNFKRRKLEKESKVDSVVETEKGFRKGNTNVLFNKNRLQLILR